MRLKPLATVAVPMKIRQNARHWAAKRALTTPGLGSFVRSKLVDLHTRVFLAKADDARAEERRAHLDDFFDATMDTYVAALRAGYSEAEAREITHVQANFDFHNHGWTEMVEFPADEIGAHYGRHREFFQRHDITPEDPLGEFRPADGVADAPATPERPDADQPNAEGGYADDVYVEADGEVRRGGTDEPEDVDPNEMSGME